jgi:hypothetical protein
MTDTSHVDDLRRRIALLERDNVALRRLMALAALAAVAILLMGQAAPFQDIHATNITAESITITDGKGVAIALGVNAGRPEVLINANTADPQPSSGLVLHAKTGTLQIGMFDRRDGTSTILMPDGLKLTHRGENRGGLVVGQNVAGVNLVMDGANQLTMMVAKGAGGLIEINDRDGRARWKFAGSDPRRP